MSKPLKDKNISIPQEVLKDLLTESEWRMIKNRWQIMQMVEDGLPIRRIASQVKVGTDTVVRTIRLMEDKGLKKPSSEKRHLKSLTPWIFGKADE